MAYELLPMTYDLSILEGGWGEKVGRKGEESALEDRILLSAFALKVIIIPSIIKGSFLFKFRMEFA